MAAPGLVRCHDPRHLSMADWRLLVALRVQGWACPTCQAGPPVWAEGKTT